MPCRHRKIFCPSSEQKRWQYGTCDSMFSMLNQAAVAAALQLLEFRSVVSSISAHGCIVPGPLQLQMPLRAAS